MSSDAGEHVVAGGDGHEAAGVRAGVHVEQEDGDRAGDADESAGAAHRHRDHGLVAARVDDDVLRSAHVRVVVDDRVGDEVDQTDGHARADADGAAREHRRDEQQVELVAGRDDDGLVAVRRAGVLVDLRAVADARLRRRGDHVDGAADRDACGARDRSARADRRDVVAVRRSDGDAVEAARDAGADLARTKRRRVAGRLLALLHDAVRPAGRGRLRQLDHDRRARLSVGLALREPEAAGVAGVADDVVGAAVLEAADRRAAAGAVDDRVTGGERRRVDRVRQLDLVGPVVTAPARLGLNRLPLSLATPAWSAGTRRCDSPAPPESAIGEPPLVRDSCTCVGETTWT